MTTPIRAGVLTASDRCSRGEREDQSGRLLQALLEELPAEVVAYRVVADDEALIREALCFMADRFACDVILTTGGTGCSPRDVTPEATGHVIDREAPGIVESIRSQGLSKSAFAMLSRARAGIRGKTLIINLPGSPSAVSDAFEVLRPVLGHASELLRGEAGDCQKVRKEGWTGPLPAHSSASHSHF